MRQVTKAVDPQNHAVWPLKELHQCLSHHIHAVYDTVEHPALGQSLRAAFDDGFLSTGNRLHRMVPYDNEFLIFTLPTTRKGTAQVSPGRGIKLHYLYYWCEAFRDPSIENTKVVVRFDPFDVGTAYAFVNNRWSECHSEYYMTFQSHSERELQLATAALLKRRQNHTGQVCVTARKPAEFLESVEKEESVLAQRLSDIETRSIYSSTAVPLLEAPAAATKCGAKVAAEVPLGGPPFNYSTYGEM